MYTADLNSSILLYLAHVHCRLKLEYTSIPSSCTVYMVGWIKGMVERINVMIELIKGMVGWIKGMVGWIKGIKE